MHTFNRTILECKLDLKKLKPRYGIAFNRTILECKLVNYGTNVTSEAIAFNRTILECKPNLSLDQLKEKLAPLIELY